MDTQTPDGTAPGAAPDPGPAAAASAGPAGTPPPQAPPAAGPWAPPAAGSRPLNGFFGGVRRLGIVRTDERWIGGVAGGFARKLGVDPLLARGILAVSVLLGGLGLVVYGVAWALLPEERDGRIHLEEMVAGRFDIGLIGAFGLTIVGLGRGTDVFWLLHVPDGLQGLAWVLFVGGLVALVVVGVNHRQSDGRPAAPRPTTPYGPGAPYRPYGPYGPYPQPGAPTDSAPAASAAPTAPAAPFGTPAPFGGPARPTSPATSETSTPMSATLPVPPPGPQTTPPPAAPYGPAPYTYGPYSTTQGPVPGRPPVATAPPLPPRPPKPPRPPRQGPGAATVGVVVSLSLLGLAVLMLADRAGWFDGPVLLTAGGIAVVLGGLGIMVSGARGRSSGLLGFLSIAGLVVLAPAVAVENGSMIWTSDGTVTSSAAQWTPTSRSEAETGLTAGVGDTTVDLTQVRLGGEAVEVPISMDVGNLRIIVPSGTGVRAVVTNDLGSITWDVDGEHQEASGVALSDREFETQAAQDGNEQLVLEVSLDAGDITIEEN
ncbi:PspC domain-containing protein [Cellulomonas soli]|uniref:Phage shock protein PspC N-terminal domain-containing protein n=1 Tax=Cellulomonas soli TaxID=931535 RepID=A0A512P8X7_9CELL|nr:PspC domain-containing protein [Cellulomonas soli]NYI57856.1 phage shock protein PspC (stress-responsive transcriptional regulator) [Cellulomonas soli]GEP67640.1 hypothetical protein CSO01_03550 [Cellulomonas soli]